MPEHERVAVEQDTGVVDHIEEARQMMSRRCYYAFMRTTFDLPGDLFRQAKAKAAEHGESLKTLVTRALAAELGRSSGARARSGMTRLPIFGDPSGPLVNLTNADIARALSDERPVASRKPRRRDAS